MRSFLKDSVAAQVVGGFVLGAVALFSLHPGATAQALEHHVHHIAKRIG